VAETVTIQGQSYLKRNPLGVLGLSLITLGIYGLYWYYKVNEEILLYTGDQTISPSRSLLAVIPGFLLIVPPFIAYPTRRTTSFRCSSSGGSNRRSRRRSSSSLPS
jgi:hypothetical protein